MARFNSIFQYIANQPELSRSIFEITDLYKVFEKKNTLYNLNKNQNNCKKHGK